MAEDSKVSGVSISQSDYYTTAMSPQFGTNNLSNVLLPHTVKLNEFPNYRLIRTPPEILGCRVSNSPPSNR
ncbi:hypothetical protein CEXT_579311 [Caerostris extrusa]|uniref:Uncharacterized protein n=1 Tax=Caerostris extrusa TaxID=172846 RepID=A0AAV4XFJ2_CAEEX|nr:hypothetical protein CEXT_579311 [Caerostris extrusa]